MKPPFHLIAEATGDEYPHFLVQRPVTMDDIVFRVAQRDDYWALAEWLVQMSQVPAQHCLHTWSGQGAQDLQKQLLDYWDDSELCYVVALRNGLLVGAMGSEYDEGLERGWLHGPHVATEDWGLIAVRLFTRLLAELPARIGQLDAYLNVENTRGRRFYAQQGFEEREHLSFDFWLTPDERPVSSDRGCRCSERSMKPRSSSCMRPCFRLLITAQSGSST